MIDIMLELYIYSVLGWLLEGAWYFIVKGRARDKRMLLNLPMCPVYGLGAVMLVHMLSGFYESYMLLFLFGSLLASAVELIYFLINEAAFGIMVWDYSDQPMNFLGGVCIFYTLMWGVLAIALVKLINPVLCTVIGGMSEEFKLLCAVFCGVVIAKDLQKTCRFLWDFRCGREENLPPCFWYMRKKT